MSSKWSGFIHEAANAIVEHNKKKIREGRIDYYLNQKKQLWYTLMTAIDDNPEASSDDPKKEEPKA